MSRFADFVAGQIRSQNFSKAEELMGDDYFVNGNRGGDWFNCKPLIARDDWNLYSSGFTWRGIVLIRGPERVKVQLSKRDKQLLRAAWKLAKSITDINRKEAKRREQMERERLEQLSVML